MTLTEAQAEALLAHPEDKRVDPRIRLQARGKLTSALLSDRTYTPPLLREDERCGDAVPHQGDVSERGHNALMDALRRGEIR